MAPVTEGLPEWPLAGQVALTSLPHLRLAAGEVLVLLAPRRLAAGLTGLSSAERARCARFRLLADQERFTVAHVLKRRAIGGLLAQAPESLAFGLTPEGKPCLADATLHFSLSHSGAWVALAATRDQEVGVDLEQADRMPKGLPVEAVFHPDDGLRGAATEVERFFAAWTLKEAVGKCTGLGLGLPFPELSLSPQDAAGEYRARHADLVWHARQGRLPDGTYLALAAARPWASLRTLEVV